MSDNNMKPVIAVVDVKELRAAGLVSLLMSWDALKSYSLESMSDTRTLRDISGEANYRLVIFNLGGASLFEEEFKQAIRLARSVTSSPAIVVISDRDETDEVLRALSFGVQGFVPTGGDANLTRSALAFILQGGSYFPPAALRALASSREPEHSDAHCGEEKSKLVPIREENGDPEEAQEHDDSDGSSKFTVREAEVLEQLQLGLANKLIARQLGMTEATVKVHVRHIMRKLGAANRTQAALCTRVSSTVDFVQANAS